MSAAQDYVLGTGDPEIERLGVQHAAWRADMLAAWRTAGFGPRQTVLDIGCGPGYGAIDLAGLVGSGGRVVAVDQSERFLAALDEMCRARGIGSVTACRADLETGAFPPIAADAAWCRWVLSFTRDPREVLARVAAALKPRGVAVFHEYFDYATWRAAPRCEELERFVAAVMRSWRDHGGEPDAGLLLPGRLAGLGFALRRVRPIVEAVQPGDAKWAWLGSFLDLHRQRLADMGYLSDSESARIQDALTALEAARGMMITPGVLEVIARRR
jgi:SAM-dependent methyltransferase